jgi:hypothetical protein
MAGETVCWVAWAFEAMNCQLLRRDGGIRRARAGRDVTGFTR